MKKLIKTSVSFFAVFALMITFSLQQVTAAEAAQQCLDRGVRKVAVYIHGPGKGRRVAIHSIHKSGLDITLLREVTGLPHNGCRPKKRRRL